MSKRIYHGWLFAEPGSITLKWTGAEDGISFPDNNDGACLAADTITQKIGGFWRLEPFAPLGYRIYTEPEHCNA